MSTFALIIAFVSSNLVCIVIQSFGTDRPVLDSSTGSIMDVSKF